LRDLTFLSDLQELCLLGIQTKVKDDRAAFTLAGLEELALITGCRQPIPECHLPVLRRLVLVERDGMDCRKRPALEELKVGVWRTGGVDFLSGGTRLRNVELEGKYQTVSLAGIETCELLEVFCATDAALEDLAPLRGLRNLRELRLVSRLKAHGSLDLGEITSPALERLSIGAAIELKNIASLANLPSLQQLQLVDVPLTKGDHAVLNGMSDRVDVTILN